MSLDFSAVWEYRDIIFRGLANTLLISAIAIPAGVCLGVLICLLRISRRNFLRWPAMIYIEVIRNVPLLILIFLMFFALPFYGLRFSGMTIGFICLSLYGGAYFAEIFRGGVEAVSSGQFDAARALGLKYGFYMRKVIFPQIYSYAFPPSTNISLTIIKESSLLSLITVTELTYSAHEINGRTFTFVESFTVIALLYWLISIIFLKLSSTLESRVKIAPAGNLAAIR